MEHTRGVRTTFKTAHGDNNSRRALYKPWQRKLKCASNRDGRLVKNYFGRETRKERIAPPRYFSSTKIRSV